MKKVVAFAMNLEMIPSTLKTRAAIL